MLLYKNTTNFALMGLTKLYVAILLIFSLTVNAQLKVVKPVKNHPKRTTLAFGAGLSQSVIYLNRNVKDNNDAIGFHANVLYGGSKLLRYSAEYTFFRTFDIDPTWYNIKAQTMEFNVHFLARFNNRKAVFYPIVGLSYNLFAGYFTGINDHLNLASVYERNQDATSRWLGLNVGTGFEYFFKPGSFFVDYKMRVGIAEGNQRLNIMDVCFSAGLRFNLRVPTFYSIFKGTRGRYFLDTKDSDW
jgi:hypothetical protein